MRRDTIWVLFLISAVCPCWRLRKQQNCFPLQKRKQKQDSHLYRAFHYQKGIRHIYTYKTGWYKIIKWWSSLKWPRSMWHHIQNYNIIQRSAYMIHAVSVIKYQKYPSIIILKQAMFWLNWLIPWCEFILD